MNWDRSPESELVLFCHTLLGPGIPLSITYQTETKNKEVARLAGSTPRLRVLIGEAVNPTSNEE